MNGSIVTHVIIFEKRRQGRDNRLHDRLRYKLLSGGQWLIERLAP
ncbi:MAG: pyridoxine 5'-phosphate oxidase C-terminal domain-containing protein [Thermodesulfobacteriota bacterium]